MLGLIGLITANQFHCSRKSPCRRNIYVAPHFFPWPRSEPQFFHSRIATGVTQSKTHE